MIRVATLRRLRRTVSAGFTDSPAATVTNSVPKYDRNTVNAAGNNAPNPCGNQPPCPVKFDIPGAATCGNNPTIAATPTAMNNTIDATLINANQNSNRPNDDTAAKFTAVKNTMNTNADNQFGTPGANFPAIAAPATASNATITHQ
ncbi:hypothetical protein GCM10023321_36880 [Pseudonocardia eucalypti]|uniref:Uncharacterized protein n=1 Tax=Pseudonocardia eucalypti TaxID=648755 RepID=A0ABP9Q9Q1_9PSEU